MYCNIELLVVIFGKNKCPHVFSKLQRNEFSLFLSYQYQTLSVEDLLVEHASIANVESQHLDLSHLGKPSARLTIQGNIDNILNNNKRKNKTACLTKKLNRTEQKQLKT